ncbi:glutamyl-tRNA reductase [Streptomyces sp. NPDC005805]|uniref:glutamyl-tRNA reductase n=1 Tax=Streptomyces sp. NPDC005805 TaxID=3157068 RepID=UPI0033FEFC2D
MSLLVVGLSHRSAPVSVLERAALPADAQVKLLQDTLAAEPATEAAVLATCNRIELYADVDKFHAGVAELSTLLAQHSGVGLEELTPYLYVHYEDRAVHHLFSVACGLDSMVVGEGQILGQIKDALARGQELHTAGRLINDLFQQALRVGKRAHSETGIDRAGQSLVTFGLEQLAAGEPVERWAEGKRALVIGAGSMSSLAATTLARLGVRELVIANRTPERAERLAAVLAAAAGGLRAHAVRMSAVPDELTRADVVVSCTGATGLVLTADAVASALAQHVDVDAAALPAADLRAPEGSVVARLAALAARDGRVPEPAPPEAGGAAAGTRPDSGPAAVLDARAAGASGNGTFTGTNSAPGEAGSGGPAAGPDARAAGTGMFAGPGTGLASDAADVAGLPGGDPRAGDASGLDAAGNGTAPAADTQSGSGPAGAFGTDPRPAGPTGEDARAVAAATAPGAGLASDAAGPDAGGNDTSTATAADTRPGTGRAPGADARAAGVTGVDAGRGPGLAGNGTYTGADAAPGVDTPVTGDTTPLGGAGDDLGVGDPAALAGAECPLGLEDLPVDALAQHGAWVDNAARAAAHSAAAARTGAAADGGPVRLALLDLAMPRDIDAAVHRLGGVRLVDIESLAEASADAPMAADVDAVRTIVSDEVAAFGAAQRAAHITPTVVALRTMAADVVAGEMARLDGRLTGLDEKQRAEITQTVRRVVDKLLHAPTVRVKQLASEPGGAGYADALRTLFDLDPETVASVSRADLNDADVKNRGRV